MIIVTLKKCYSCNIQKENIFFHKNKKSNDGFSNRCKSCVKKYDKIYYEKNNKKIKERKKSYYVENINSIKLRDKNYRDKNKKLLQHKKRIWEKNKIITDNFYYLKSKIKNSIRESIKRYGYTKKSKTFEILGCDYETFKKHIESQFIDGMSWDNKNEWHIDHIIPVSSAKNENEMILLNHYLNLQPLWATDNLSKGSKLPALIMQNKIKLSIAKEKGLKLTQQSIF
jgi:hypothetical protein